MEFNTRNTHARNDYLASTLSQVMHDEVPVEVFVKLNTHTIKLQGYVIGVNVNDRNPMLTLETVHEGKAKVNIINLSNVASINYLADVQG